MIVMYIMPRLLKRVDIYIVGDSEFDRHQRGGGLALRQQRRLPLLRATRCSEGVDNLTDLALVLQLLALVYNREEHAKEKCSVILTEVANKDEGRYPGNSNRSASAARHDMNR